MANARKRRKSPLDRLVSDIESWQDMEHPQLVEFARYWHGRKGKDAEVCRKFWEWVFNHLRI